MNFLTVEQLVENLTILLDGDIDSFEGKEVALFLTEEDIMDILTKKQSSNDVTLHSDVSGCNIFTPQQPLAIVWDHANGKRYWCVGFFLREDEACIQVDYLEQKSTKGLNQS